MWQKLHASQGSPVFHNYHNMQHTIPALLGLPGLRERLFKPGFFTRYRIREHRGYADKEGKSDGGESESEGVQIQIVKPILRWPGGEVKPGYQVATRGNGVDAPRWPGDLSVQVVS